MVYANVALYDLRQLSSSSSVEDVDSDQHVMHDISLLDSVQPAYHTHHLDDAFTLHYLAASAPTHLPLDIMLLA
jgi:hypothetical protein